jgi:hypothetical protein
MFWCLELCAEEHDHIIPSMVVSDLTVRYFAYFILSNEQYGLDSVVAWLDYPSDLC